MSIIFILVYFFWYTLYVSKSIFVALCLTTILKRKIVHQLLIRNEDGHTSFHVACSNGSTDIVELIIKKSIDLNIDLNAKYKTWGWTGFYLSHWIDQTNFDATNSTFHLLFFSVQV